MLRNISSTTTRHDVFVGAEGGCLTRVLVARIIIIIIINIIIIVVIIIIITIII